MADRAFDWVCLISGSEWVRICLKRTVLKDAIKILTDIRPWADSERLSTSITKFLCAFSWPIADVTLVNPKKQAFWSLQNYHQYMNTQTK